MAPSPPNWHWRSGAVEPGPAVVFDVDGVLSDASGRQHLLARPRRDWDAFFEACGQDPLLEDTARLIELLDPNLHVVLLTARPARVQPQTIDWLQRVGIGWDLLIMRDFGDYSPSRSYKQLSVVELRQAGIEPVLAFEDDVRNVEMFHAENIPCIYIHSGYYQ